MSLHRYLKRLKSVTNDESNGRHLIPKLLLESCGSIREPRILDVGAGYGTDISDASRLLRTFGVCPKFSAIESFPRAVMHLSSQNIEVVSINIETDRFPFSDNSFDVVLCNQVLEHTKEIFWVISEIARITKPEGRMILGVPNLGSLHNRVALLFGYQPPAINVFGPHVRGFTKGGLVDFLEKAGTLKVTKVLGGNFYPFRPKLSRPLSWMFPSLSVSSFYVVRRTNARNFLSIFETEDANVLVDTPYYRGQL